jgi:hypothetical protein
VITVCPNGGIGNQLFQYSAGRALSLFHDTALEIDTWHYGAAVEAGDRPLLLHKLSVPARWRLYTNDGFRAAHALPARVYRRFVRPLMRTIVTDASLRTGQDFFENPASSVLVGYFQSTRCFLPYADVIRNDINLSQIASEEALSLGRILCEDEWCAVQVRRGDYVGDALFDVIAAGGYFEKAIRTMRSVYPGTRFIVLSDDPAWCRTQPMFAGMRIHEPPQHAVADAIYLMSRCAQHIISNSSYGWWGAFLASARGAGPVIAPKLWLRDLPTIAAELSLPNWILI